MSSQFIRSILAATATCALLTAICVGMAGCDNSDARARADATAAIEAAVAELGKIYIGSSSLGDADSREQAYRKLSSIVAESSGSGEVIPEQKQARQAIAAMARIGLAEIELQRATDTDLATIRMMHEVYGLITSATQYGASQKAAASFNFTDTLREIESEQAASIARKDELLLQAKALERQLDDMDSMIKNELGEYDRLREQAAVARERAIDAPLDERQAQIEGAARISREADAHQVKAANAEATYDMMVPRLAELRSRIAQTETELISFENTRKQIQERKANLEREAVQNAADLQRTIGEIDAKFAALVAYRSSELEPHFAAGLGLAQEAVSTLNAARTGQSNLPRLKLVDAQQMLGQLHWRRAQSLERFAQLVASLAANSALLQRGAEDSALLDELRSQIDEATAAAAGSLEAAAQAAASASLAPETLRLLQELHARVSGVEYVPPVEAPADEMPADDAVAVETTGTPADTIRAIQQLVSQDRYLEVLDYIKIDPTYERVARRLIGAMDRLNDATVGRFKQSFYGMLKDPSFWNRVSSMIPGMSDALNNGMIPLPSAGAGIDDLLALDPSTLEFQYDRTGTTAWVADTDSLMADVIFIHEGGKWIIDRTQDQVAGDGGMPTGMEGMAEAMSQFIDPAVNAVVASLDDTTQRVKRDEFGDEWSMIASLIGTTTTKLQAVFQSMMGNMGGQFGGGGMGGG